MLEPSGSAFGSQPQSVKELQSKIHRLMLAESKQETAQAQSSDSQKEEKDVFRSGLKGKSRHFEAQETLTWTYAQLWQVGTGDITIEYSRDFNDQVIDAAYIAELRACVEVHILTRKTALETLVKGEVVQVDDIDAELAAAAKEGAIDQERTQQLALSQITQQEFES